MALNILVVSQLFYPDTVGGSERVIYEQSRGLARRGHQVSVVVQRSRADSPDQETVDGVRVLRYGSLSFRKWFGASWTDLTAGKRLLRRLLLSERFDVVVLHHPFPALAYFKARGGNVAPALYVFHASVYRELLHQKEVKGRPVTRSIAGGFLGFLATPYLLGRLRRAERAVLRKSQRVAVLSDFSKKIVWETYGIEEAHLSLIPGGVDSETFRPHPHLRALRDRLKLPTEATVILTVRRLVPRTGVEELLRAAAEILRTRTDILFLIGGEGPEIARLRGLARKLGINRWVTFIGFIPPRDLPDYYAAADVFVLPTVAFEGFGIATLEALSSGTPVVGTPVGATPEILSALDPALIAPDETPSGLAEAIRKFLARPPADRQSLREKSRELAVNRYPWSESVAALESELVKLSAMVR